MRLGCLGGHRVGRNSFLLWAAGRHGYPLFMLKIPKRLLTQALRWLYSLLSSGLAVMWMPARLFCRTKVSRLRLDERLGRHSQAFKDRLGPKTGPRFWIHAVSVGEVDVALCLIEALREKNPHAEFILTTVTRSGHQRAARCGLMNVHISYAPLDFAGAVRRSFLAFAADILVLVELEIWPNQLWEANRLGVPIALVNARLPAGDLRKYRWGRWFMKDVFGLLSVVCAQTKEDAEAFHAMGVERGRIHITGSMKMDAAIRKAERPLDAARVGGPEIWNAIAQRTWLVGGSTHPGEEAILFEMLLRMKMEFPGLLLAVAPRDTSRAKKLVRVARQKGLTCLLWSEVLAPGYQIGAEFTVLVIDTIGDLDDFYRFARVVFVGKSLTARGGQNPMEPTAASRAVIFGPSMENFDSVVRCFLQSGAAIQVSNAEELESEVIRLLGDSKAAEALGQAARAVVLAQAGATRQTVQLLGGS